MLDKATFAVRLTALAERFGRAEPSDGLTREYYENLSGLDTDAFLAASRTIFREDNYFPSPARFLDLAGTSVTTQAEEAWQHIMKQVRAGQVVSADDTAFLAMQDVGGYPALAYCDEVRDLPHRHRAFLEAYKRRASEDEQRALTAPTLFEIDE